jgi:hypothetical protein
MEEKRTLPRWIEDGFRAGPSVSCQLHVGDLVISQMLTRVCLISVIFGDLTVVHRIREDDTSSHSIILSILYLGTTIDPTVISHCNLAFELDTRIL